MSSELPNGWGIRFSASRTYDTAGKDVEFGIEPDIKVEGELKRTDEKDLFIDASARLLTVWIKAIKKHLKK